MALQKFTNNATATLSASINGSATTITVSSGQGALFPSLTSGDYFYATIIDSSNNIEIVKITARSTDSLTAVRAQENTTGRSFVGGDQISLRVTAATLNNFAAQDKDNSFTGTNSFSGTSNFTGGAGSTTFTNIPTFSSGILPILNGGTGSATATGSGDVVLDTSPTIDTPTITTPTISDPSISNPTITTYGSIKALFETATITASAPPAPTNFDVMTQAVQYYTSNASANFTLNFRGNGSTTLNSILGIGQSVTIALMVTNGTTAYRPTAFQIDGAAVTPDWQAGYTPTTGNASSIDVYTFSIVKTASATYVVLASQTQYA
jgi:hypothetical protein